MTRSPQMALDRWLARLRHDLVKRALIPARDLCDLGPAAAPVRPADVEALRRGLLALVDEEGRPATASALWRALRDEAEGAPAAALDDFERAVLAAEAAARALPADLGGAVAAALALAPAFDDLKSALARALDTPRRTRGG
jgi:hypothetical protein